MPFLKHMSFRATLLGVLVTAAALPSAAGNSASSQTPDATLTIRVTDIPAPDGQMMIALFDSQDGYAAERPVKDAVIAVDATAVEAEFSALPSGEYAFKLYHDANGNGKLDTDMLGIPSEPYAFSRDASDPFSAPEWEEAKFTLPSGDTQRSISLK